MSSEPIPESLRRFVLTSVPSVPWVEAFLLFRNANGAEAFDVELVQSYQKIAGRAGGSRVVGSLRGAALDFGFIDGTEKVRVEGVVAADRVVATVARGTTAASYVATRN